MAKKTEPPQQSPRSFAEALAAAGVEDLAALRAEIARLTTEIDTIVADRKREVDGLRAAARVLEYKLNGAPQRGRRPAGEKPAAAKGAKTANPESDKIRTQIHDLIAEEGSMTVPAIAARLGRSNIQVALIIRHCDWFKNDDGEITNA